MWPVGRFLKSLDTWAFLDGVASKRSLTLAGGCWAVDQFRGVQPDCGREWTLRERVLVKDDESSWL